MIVRVVLAGNTMSSPIKIANEFKKKYGHEVAKYRTEHLHSLDQELSNACSACEIEIMSGESDLSSVAMPQRPVPKSLFPRLSVLESAKFSTNPNEFEIEAVRYAFASLFPVAL
jgi:DNA polymerase delta subunit 2